MADVPNESSKLPSAHAKRLGWALDKYGHLLAEAVGKDVSAEALELRALPEAEIPERLVRSIMEKADPTQAKTMTAWIVKQYAASKLWLEDTGTAHETLEMFDRYSPNLPIEQRDIGRYPDLASAWKAVLPFATEAKEKLSGRAQKTMDRDKAYAESRILRQDDDGFTVAVPLTEFAAKWWGRGTRWCTSAEKDNKFQHYHQKSPLIITVIPQLGEHGKFQIWASNNDLQFRDAADEEVSDTVIAENWERFAGLVQVAFAQNGRALKWFPEHLRTEALCRTAVAQSGLALEYVPEHLRAEDICRIALATKKQPLSSTLFLDIPKHLHTFDLFRFAVAHNWQYLSWVPERLCTYDLYKFAVEHDWRAFVQIPEKMRTEELCEIAVGLDWRALTLVPEHLRTQKIYNIAVAQNIFALPYVPEHMLTEDMRKIAAERGELGSEDLESLGSQSEYREERGKDLTESPDWDLHLLDCIAEELCRLDHPQQSPAARIDRQVLGIVERFKSVKNFGNPPLP